MTHQLTNSTRDKGEEKLFMFYLGMFLISLFVFSKCNQDKRQSEWSRFDPKTAARAISMFHVERDTTKPQIKVKYNNLKLVGDTASFRSLIFAIQRPKDVTENQRDALINWINTVKIDSTNGRQ